MAAVLIFAGVKTYQSLFYSKAEMERKQILARADAEFLFAKIEVHPSYRRKTLKYKVISKNNVALAYMLYKQALVGNYNNKLKNIKIDNNIATTSTTHNLIVVGGSYKATSNGTLYLVLS